MPRHVAAAPFLAATRRPRCLQVLGSLLAGVAAVSAGQAAAADNTAGPVDLFDDRKVRKSGFDVIYEARDLDLTQNQRDGLTQYRGDLSATKQRYQESVKRIQSKVPGYIDKAYWCAGIAAGSVCLRRRGCLDAHALRTLPEAD